jgi:hypothetical protein
MMFLLRVANGAIKPPTQRSMPAKQDANRLKCSQPLPGGAMLLSLAVGESGRRSRRSRSGGGVDRFAVCTNSDKLIHEFGVGDHKINQCTQKIFLFFMQTD